MPKLTFSIISEDGCIDYASDGMLQNFDPSKLMAYLDGFVKSGKPVEVRLSGHTIHGIGSLVEPGAETDRHLYRVERKIVELSYRDAPSGIDILEAAGVEVVVLNGEKHERNGS